MKLGRSLAARIVGTAAVAAVIATGAAAPAFAASAPVAVPDAPPAVVPGAVPATGGSGQPASTGRDLTAADAKAALKAKVAGGAKTPVVINVADRRTATALKALDGAKKTGTVSGSKPVAGGRGAVVAEVDASALDKLQKTAGVTVEPNLQAEPDMSVEIPVVGADDMYRENGSIGRDQAIVVIDTGVDATHDWFDGKIATELCFSTTACPDGTNAQTGAGSAAPCPWIGCDHGTHVAGIAAGAGQNDDEHGVAVGAKIIPIMAASRRASDGKAVFWNADLQAALAWVSANVDTYNIVAVNMSLGSPMFAPGSVANPQVASCAAATTPTIAASIASLRTSGVATVTAAGNNGWAGNLNWPACLPRTVSVAATVGDDDTLADFSNRAPNVTVAAPGDDVVSSIPATAANSAPTGTKSGTSMATPIVAGAFAQLRSRHGRTTASVDEVVAALRGTATNVSVDGGATVLRRINIQQAHLQLKSHPADLDGSGGGNGKVAGDVGTDTETVIYGSQAYRFWYDATNANLRYATVNAIGQATNPITLDGNSVDGGRVTGTVGKSPSTVVEGDALHVFYRDLTRGNLRHAKLAFNRWTFENVETAGDVGGSPEAAIYNGQVNVFHQDVANGDLRRCVHANNAWSCSLIDGDANVNQKVNANVGSEIESINYGTALYIFYRDHTNGNLRVGYIASHRESFDLQVLDGAGGANGRRNADIGTGISATLYLGHPIVFYTNATDGDLMMARHTLEGWDIRTVDGAGGDNGRTANDVGAYSAAVDFDGVPHVFYYDRTRADLRVTKLTVNNRGEVVSYTSIVDGVAGPRDVTSGSMGKYVSGAYWLGRAYLTYYDESDRDARSNRFA